MNQEEKQWKKKWEGNEPKITSKDHVKLFHKDSSLNLQNTTCHITGKAGTSLDWKQQHSHQKFCYASWKIFKLEDPKIFQKEGQGGELPWAKPELNKVTSSKIVFKTMYAKIQCSVSAWLNLILWVLWWRKQMHNISLKDLSLYYVSYSLRSLHWDRYTQPTVKTEQLKQPFSTRN